MRAREAREDIRLALIWRLLSEAGLPGERYGEGEVAAVLGLSKAIVVGWIERGLLTASRLRVSKGKGWYRIRRRALRRAIADNPEVALAIMKAATKPKHKPGQ